MTLFLILTLAGCGDAARQSAPVEAQVGKNCIVYFRRDALGMAADVPASVTSGDLNGAEMRQAGKLVEVTNDWVVLYVHGRIFHIPQSVILMIEFGQNITQDPLAFEQPPPAPVPAPAPVTGGANASP